MGFYTICRLSSNIGHALEQNVHSPDCGVRDRDVGKQGLGVGVGGTGSGRSPQRVLFRSSTSLRFRPILSKLPAENILLLDREYIIDYYRIMKTTIDIPDKELEEAIRNTGAKTKRDAVVYALKDFNRRRRLEGLAAMLGTFDDFMDQEDLKKMRAERQWGKRK